MTKKLKKNISLIICLSLVLSILSGFNDKSFALDKFKEREIELIEVDTQDLIAGENFPNGVPEFKVSPNKIPKYDSNNLEDLIQIRILNLKEVLASVIVNAGDRQIANKEFTDESIYQTLSNGKKTLRPEYDIIRVPILEAAVIDDLTGEIKVDAQGRVELKKYYYEEKIEEPKKPLPVKIPKKSVYALVMGLSVIEHENTDIFAKKWFSNALSKRYINIGTENHEAPKIILNGKEVYTDTYVPTEKEISIGTFPIDNNKGKGIIFMYSKEMISPYININVTKNINDISSKTGENIKDKFSDILSKFRTNFIIKDSDNTYYISNLTVVGKDKSASDYSSVKDDEVFKDDKDYALKLEISPKAFYKFKDEEPNLMGSITQNSDIEMKKEKDGKISIFLKYDNIVRHQLKNKDLSLLTMRVIDGEKVINDEKPQVLKGNEYVEFSNVTYFKVEQGPNSKEVLNDKFEQDEKFDKDKKYKLAIRLTPRKGVIIDDSDLPKVILNGEEVKITKGFPLIQPNNDYVIISDEIVPEIVTVDSVEISPKDVTTTTGSMLQFNAEVTGQNSSNQDVVWSINGNNSNDTKITTNGVLSIGSMETSSLIYVKLRSSIDSSKSDQATVKIENPYILPKQEDKKSYKLRFTDNIKAIVDNKELSDNSMVEENKNIKLILNIPKEKEIESFKINDKEIKNSVENNMYSFNITEDTNIELKLKDKDNNNSNSNGNNNKSDSNSNNNSNSNSNSNSSISDNDTRSKGSSSSNNDKKEKQSDKNKTIEEKKDIVPKKSDESSKPDESVISIEKSTEIVNSFVDTSEITWSKKAIINIVSKGLMKGYPDGKFMPKQELNRAQAAQVLSSIIGKKSMKNLSFSDVSKDSWYFDAVNTVVEKKIFVGYENGKFMPQANITRAEIFVAIARLKDIKPLSEKETDDILKNYSDVHDIPSWSKRYIASLIKANIISGSNNKIEANGKLTREQFAIIIDNISK